MKEKDIVTEENMPEESFKVMVAYMLSTGLYAGKIPVAPGTIGTVVGLIPILIYWTKGGSYMLINQIFITLAVFFVGIWASTVVVETFKEKDPDYVVIDEIAGYMVAMIGIEPTWQNLLIAFILFRFFDILKPPPIRFFERLPSGLGVMADDIIAGLYVLGIMHLLTRFVL
ncbi:MULTISPECIES: phosphatidylglycerophosphatase A [Persephonella]|uniref:Phosphatidylglycerophosphatase A n=1 Tax=Persephonella marina (strain DSM 14350 / EX-H1) TaxID=123214 RepID=C0QTC8_PERMH|nr:MULTISPECIES: phosphatidylglycerophosphatase A [Persephonella]ACO04083.1 phosphatidylglycerophosphatase A [Persephonella marina EX-H1]